MKLHQEDLIISTFHTGGGFTVRVDTGVKILHIPSGIEITATEGRSQHANKDLALKLLTKRLEHSYKEALKPGLDMNWNY